MSLADRLFDVVFQWIQAPVIRQAAGEVARECHEAIWRQAHARVSGMSVAQGRGYLRALAPGFVCNEVDAVLSRRRASPYIRGQVIAQAIEQVLDLLADDILYAQPRRASASLAA